MPITPDQIVYWRWHSAHLDATIVFTWLVIILLTTASWLLKRHLQSTALPASRWETGLEVIVEFMRDQIRQICPVKGDSYLPFVGTLFLFIAVSNFLEIIPGWHTPTGSLSTTSALAICVAVAVPVFGIRRQGVVEYLRGYVSPSFLMLPFHVLSELSRNLALAVRLFGNIMSGSLIVGILLVIAPLFVPMIMQILGLLIGTIQAYIFAVLAMVYIAAAVQSHRDQERSTHG